MIGDREARLLDPGAQRLLEIYRNEQHTSLLHEVDEISKSGPLSPGVLGIAALSCSALERYEEGALAARKAIQSEPRWAWLYHAFAAAEAGQRHLKEAISAQSQAVSLMPGEPAYTTALARFQRLAGEPGESVRTARRALMSAPDHAGALNELGLALVDSGDAAAGLKQFRMAQAVAPAAPDGHLNEGVLHLRAGARGEARRCFREALRRHPGLTEAEDGMADSLAAPGTVLRRALGYVLTLGRVTLIGWLMIAFLYYVVFRILQLLWRLIPGLLPVGQGLLAVTVSCLAGGLVLGHLLRFGFRTGWPR